MKKYLVTSAILCALSVVPAILPVFLRGMQGKELLAYAGIYVLLLFFAALIMLAMLRKYRSDVELAQKITLLSWQLPEGSAHGGLAANVARSLSLVVAFVAAAATAIMLFAQPDTLILIMVMLFLLLLLSGIAVFVAVKKYEYYGGQNGFRLCHNALYLCGSRTVLNGDSCAVYDVAFDRKNGVLCLGVLQHKHTVKLNIPVPPDKADDTDAFITDLQAHFAAQKGQQ